MLMGAVAGFSVAASTGDPWIGLVIAMLAGGAAEPLHAVVTIHLRAEQVDLRAGPDVPRLRRWPASSATGLSNAGAIAPLPGDHDPGAVADPDPRARSCSASRACSTYVGFVLVPLAWYWIDRTRPGLHLRAVGERPAAADAQGIDVIPRPLRVRAGRRTARRARRGDDHARHLARLVRRPDRRGTRLDRDRAGDLRPVEPDPGRARAPTCSGRSSGSSSTSRASRRSSASTNPFQAGRSATFFLEMLPYLFVDGRRRSSGRARRCDARLGAPAALGIPYVARQNAAA